MNIKRLSVYVFALLAILFTACEKDTPIDNEIPEEAKSILILSEGSSGHNDSKLSKYWIEDEIFEENYFTKANNRGLGDTANDMLLYGSKLYILVNVSGTVEVIDPATGKSIKQIQMKTTDGTSKEPRQIAAYDGKLYVTSFDDTVTRIDTLTLQVDAEIVSGMDPEGITISNGKIYVANSGGLNFMNGYNNTLSIIDVASFTKTDEIEVVINPADVDKDSKGNIYISSIGDYVNVAGAFQKLDPATKQVTLIEEVGATGRFVINNDYAYIIKGEYGSPHTVLVYDCINEEIVTDNFITDGTELGTINNISIDPQTEDVFIMEAEYAIPGNVYWFGKDGELKLKLPAIGMYPTSVVVL